MEAEEALERLKSKISGKPQTEQVSLLRCGGRVLAEDVRAQINVPAFPKSAVDGYAVRSEDVLSADGEHPVLLQVLGENFAGDYHTFSYQEKSAVRVMTGGYVPEEYDTVVRQEDTTKQGDTVLICRSAKKHENYCAVGEDIEKGAVVLQEGTRIDSRVAGVFASLGINQVTVQKKLKAAILSTGSELQMPGETLMPGKIYNNSSYMLREAILKEGLEVVLFDTCTDDEKMLETKICEAVEQADILITTGGVSVGEKDLIPKVLENLQADILFQGVNIQPGTPTMGSVFQGRPMLSLSGNPFAAIANFELYFWSLAAHMTGCDAFEPERRTALLATEYRKVNRARRLVRAREENGRVFIPTNVHAASVISTLTQCNCFIDVPQGTKLEVGDQVVVRYFKG